MLLSVVVYNHKLTPGQWLGAAVVFAGISVEAWVKRKGEIVVTACVNRVLIASLQTSTQNVSSRRRRRLVLRRCKGRSIDSCDVFVWDDTLGVYIDFDLSHLSNPNYVSLVAGPSPNIPRRIGG